MVLTALLVSSLTTEPKTQNERSKRYLLRVTMAAAAAAALPFVASVVPAQAAPAGPGHATGHR